MAVRATVCERMHVKYQQALGSTMIIGGNGEQLRVTIPAGEVVATWIMKKDRLSYSSGFLFGPEGMRKLSARDVSVLLDEASSAADAADSNRGPGGKR